MTHSNQIRTRPCKGGCGTEIPANLATCGEVACRRAYGNTIWRVNWKARHAEWIAQGLCGYCGAKPRRGKKMCADCVKSRAVTRAKKAERELLRKAAKRIVAGKAKMKVENAQRRDRVNEARKERGLPPSAAKAPVVPKDAPLPLDV